MHRFVWLGRVVVWVLALLLGALASRGLADIATEGRLSTALVIAGIWLVFGFVAASVIAAAEALIPALRRDMRHARRDAVRHP
jgi:hypothetical protein